MSSLLLLGCEKSQPCQYELTEGWHEYEYEVEGPNWLRWSAGRGKVKVSLVKAATATMTGAIISMHGADQVDILVNGKRVTTLNLTRDKFEFKSLEPLQLALKKGDNLVEFMSQKGPVTAPPDPRPLAMAIKNLRLTVGNAACELKR
jgi:hypothetical protein